MTRVSNPPGENQVEPEILAKAIMDVSAAAKRLLSSRLTERAILVLIRDSLGSSPGMGIADIRAVLNAASELEARYIRKPKK